MPKKNSTKSTKHTKGQASIFVGMMMLTFILLLMFVVNTGMLVNAKINLQNAADLAAYAGAATQARLLNNISYLNYEMRRNFKKFLFRYYVIGNMGQDNFGTQSSTEHVWSPDGSIDYKVPIVCVIFRSGDNFCRNPTLTRISIPSPSPLDQIQGTLIGALEGFELLRQQNCISIGQTNKTLLYLWLYNADPTLAQVEQEIQAADPAALGALVKIKAVAQGLGLMPASLLLKIRIETLMEYLNAAPQKNVNLAVANNFLRPNPSFDSAATERTIQAYYSAFYTLGEYAFPDPASIVLDELLPTSTEGANLMGLSEVKVSFDTWALDFQLPTGAAGTTPADCNAFPLLVPVTNLPISFIKMPDKLTYYAIRLKARARILFSPFGSLTLKAYSAAQPFGSRIGPTAQAEESYYDSPLTPSIPHTDGDLGKIPDLSVIGEKRWKDNEILVEFYNQLAGGSASVMGTTIDQAVIDAAIDAAMAPNPSEMGLFNIPADINPDPEVNDPFLEFFNNEKNMYAMWAPLGSATKEANVKVRVVDAINSLSTAGAGGIPPTLQTALVNAMTKYIDDIRVLTSGNLTAGYRGETSNLYKIYNPYVYYADKKPIQLQKNLLSQTDARTSWNMVKDAKLHSARRAGYSVKFVSFETLMGKSLTSNGSDNWTNVPGLDAEAGTDLFGGQQTVLH